MSAKLQDGTWKCGHCGEEFKQMDFKVTSLIYDNKWVCEDCAIHEDQIWLKHIDKTKFSAQSV